MPLFANLFTYDNVGLISASLVTLSTLGIGLQLKKIIDRRKAFVHDRSTEKATQGLSLIRFSTSFSAFFAVFLYGLTLQKFNHYLVWPRVLALLLVLSIVYQIWRDRKDRLSLAAFLAGTSLFGVASLMALTQYRIAVHSTGLPHLLLLASLVLLMHGGGAQIMEIRRTRRTGALSLPMHQLFFVKDASSILFALTMGFQDGWPVFVMSSFSIGLQLTTMWHFRWVRKLPAHLDM